MRTWADQMTDACPLAVATETLSAWRDATLNGADATFLSRHTPTCRACAERLALFDAIEQALRQQRTPAPRPSLWGEVALRIADEAHDDAQSDAHRDEFADDGYPNTYPDQTNSSANISRPTRLPPTSQPQRLSRSGPADSGRLPLARQPSRRRWGALGAASAAVLIAALLIGLLVSHQALIRTGGHPTPTAHTPVGSATAAASPSATSVTLPAGWQNLPVIANDPGQPVIAPSNPQVVYFAAAGSSTKGVAPTYLLARSDDGGVTIHHLPFPTLNGRTIDTFSPLFVNLFVSPLNPQVVYFYTQVSLAACPANFAPLSLRRVSLNTPLGARHGTQSLASAICQPQYISTNGGETWRLLTLPAKGLLGLTSPDNNRHEPAIQAQGTRLYSTVADVLLAASGVPLGGRLVVSEDDGVTWTLADAPIAAQGLVAYDYAPAPSGSTVFVVTENPQTMQAPTYNPDPHLWRSDDAGATWTELGYTPHASATSGGISGMAAIVAAGGQPILYLDTATDTTASSTTLEASVDGGQTWQPAPDAGSLGDTAPLGATSSGKVVMVFADGSYRAWAVADSGWTTVAPSLGSSFSSNLDFIGAADESGDGKRALYATGQFNSVNIVVRYVLP